MFQAENFSIAKSTASGQQPAGAMWASGYPRQEGSVLFSVGVSHTTSDASKSAVSQVVFKLQRPGLKM